MSAENVTIILSILGAVGTWTVTVALLVLWLANRFRAVESLIYTELRKHKHEHENRIRLIERQLHRLQIKVFGFAPLAIDELVDRLDDTSESQ